MASLIYCSNSETRKTAHWYGQLPSNLSDSCAWELFERLVNQRLRYILEPSSKLDNFQAGFRKVCSTADDLIRITTSIQRDFQEKQHTVAVFLDLAAAYDLVHPLGSSLSGSQNGNERQLGSLAICLPKKRYIINLKFSMLYAQVQVYSIVYGFIKVLKIFDFGKRYIKILVFNFWGVKKLFLGKSEIAVWKNW